MEASFLLEPLELVDRDAAVPLTSFANLNLYKDNVTAVRLYGFIDEAAAQRLPDAPQPPTTVGNGTVQPLVVSVWCLWRHLSTVRRFAGVFSNGVRGEGRPAPPSGAKCPSSGQEVQFPIWSVHVSVGCDMADGGDVLARVCPLSLVVPGLWPHWRRVHGRAVTLPAPLRPPPRRSRTSAED